MTNYSLNFPSSKQLLKMGFIFTTGQSFQSAMLKIKVAHVGA